MAQGIEWLFGGEEVIEETKSPCRSRGFLWECSMLIRH